MPIKKLTRKELNNLKDSKQGGLGFPINDTKVGSGIPLHSPDFKIHIQGKFQKNGKNDFINHNIKEVKKKSDS